MSGHETTRRLNIWSGPLTDNERAIIRRVSDSGSSDDRRRWLNHVVEVADGLAADLAAWQARAEQAEKALAQIAHPRWHSPGYARLIAQNALAASVPSGNTTTTEGEA